jgi:hypothetical protein
MKLSRLLLLLFAVGCLAILIALASEISHLVADREPARIDEIPVYPTARQVAYSNHASANLAQAPGISSNSCQSLSFVALDAPDMVHAYYRKTLFDDRSLLRRDWKGDGTIFPEYNPVNFYRKARGGMQQLSVLTRIVRGQTLVQISLCKLP